jgi:hypothetical protein
MFIPLSDIGLRFCIEHRPSNEARSRYPPERAYCPSPPSVAGNARQQKQRLTFKGALTMAGVERHVDEVGIAS